MTDGSWPSSGGTLAIDSRESFQDAVRRLLTAASAQGCRQMTLCDPDFSAWPLNDEATLEALTAWTLPHRRMVLLARDFDGFERGHPRWVAWRRHWGHVVECRAADEQDRALLPSLMVAAPVGAIRRADTVHWRGWGYSDAADVSRCTELVSDALQRSSPAFPVTQLGL